MRSWTILESVLQKVTAHRKRLFAGKRLGCWGYALAELWPDSCGRCFEIPGVQQDLSIVALRAGLGQHHV